MRLLIFSLLIIATTALATPLGLGLGQLHVQPAWTVPKGNLYLGTHSRAFFKDEVRELPDGTSSGVTYWDVQGGLGFTYGFTSKLQFSLSQIIYQDNHKGGKGYNLPDDLFLRAKLGNIGSDKGNFRLGLAVDLKLPTAEYHNLALEPYSAGRIGVGFNAYFSIVSEPLFPSLGININANVGIFNHNDLGLRLTNLEQDTITVQKATQELLYGFSFSKTGQEFGFFLELYGRSFLQKPPVTAFTRENSLYVAPGITYATNSYLTLMVALDLRILGGKDETAYDGEMGSPLHRPWQTVPNLPSWRINVGASIALSRKPTTRTDMPGVGGTVGASGQSAPVSEKLYEELASERRKTESAEAELERIRAERQRMEDLLKRLREVLEWPATPSQQKEKKPEKKDKPE